MWDLPPSGDVAPHVTSVWSPSLAQSCVWCRHPRGKPCYALTMSGQKNGVQHATAIYPIPRYTRPWYIGRTLYITTFFKIIWNRKGLGLENLGKLRSGCAVVLKTTSLQVYNQPCSWCSVLEQSWLVTNHSRLFREASPDFKFNP